MTGYASMMIVQLILVFGGLGGLLVWQLRDVRKAQAKSDTGQRLFFREIEPDEKD